jgi:hypothetical protein
MPEKPAPFASEYRTPAIVPVIHRPQPLHRLTWENSHSKALRANRLTRLSEGGVELFACSLGALVDKLATTSPRN